MKVLHGFLFCRELEYSVLWIIFCGQICIFPTQIAFSISDYHSIMALYMLAQRAKSNSVVDGLLCLQLRKQLRLEFLVFCQDWIFHKAFCRRHGHTQLQICLWNYLFLQNMVNFDNIKVTSSLCTNKALRGFIQSMIFH